MLTIQNAVLLVIDVQGKLAQLMHDKATLFANVMRMIGGATVLDLPILWTEQVPEKLGQTTPEVADLLKEVAEPIHKITFSSCGNDAFMEQLQATGRKQILLTGIETHICVYQTAIDLLKQGYEVYVVTDAVSSRVPNNIAIGVERMKGAGAISTSTEMALFEMLGKAEGPQFKAITKIVK